MFKQQTEKKNDLIKRAEEIVKTAEAEKRELTEAEAAELAEIRDDVRKIKDQLGLVKDIKELDGEKMPAKVEVEEDGDKEIEVKETRAFEQYLRDEAVNLRDDNNTLAKATQGAIIPVTIAKRIIKKVYDIAPVLERSSKYNAKGTFSIPYYSEDAENAITVAFQGAAFSKLSANSGNFTTISLTGYVAGALSLIDRALINNVDFDIVGFVVDEMAYHIARFIENVLLNGSGAISGQEGTITGLSTIRTGVTTAAATAITSDEVIKLKDSVKDAFQNNAMFVMSPATRTALRLLKDEVGRYLLQDDITAPFGSTLLGKPIYVSDNMPDIAANKAVIYYGDFRCLATKFSENMNIQVLREKYADQHADGVIGWFEFDAKIQDAQGLAALKMAAA